MGWRGVTAAVAMAAMFLIVSFSPMASAETMLQPAAQPTPGQIVNSVTAGDQINPRMFVAEGGKVYVVWEEVIGGSSRIFFSMSENDGGSFLTRVRVDDIAPGVKCLTKDPVVVVNSTGTIFVAWSDNRTGTYQLYYTMGDGGHFGADTLVSGTGLWVNQSLPDMAIYNDNIFLVWSEAQRSAGNNTHVKFSYSTNSGSSFTSPKRIDTPIEVMELYPSLAVRGSKVVVAWHDSRDNPLFDVRVAVSNNNGQTFATGQKVSGAAAVEHWYPTVEILPNGRIFVAWQERNGGDFQIRGVTSTTNDQTFTTPYLVASGDHDVSEPTSSVDPRGVLWMAYRGEESSAHRVFYIRSNDGAVFSAPSMLDNYPATEQWVGDVCTLGNGTAYFVYQDDRLDSKDVLFSKIINEKPVISIVYPISGSVKDKLVLIAGNCSDPDTTPVLQVQVQLKEKGGPVVMDWTPAVVANQALWNITIDSAAYDNGLYEVRARSYDGALYSTEASIELTFDNGIQPFVELSISPADISFAPESPVAGEQVTITAEVSNTGNNASQNVQVQFLRGAVSLGYVTISTIPAGTKGAALMSWNALEGTFDFIVIVDPNNLIEEPSEADNTATKPLTVAPAPVLKADLAITADNITWTPAIIHVGERVNISAKVANIGKMIATNVKVEFQVDNLYFTYRRTGQINPGEFYTVFAEWDATTVGPHSFTVIVDPLPREQDEESTRNNMATRQFMVYEESAFKPDLAINNASVNVLPSPPKIGQTITFTAIVSNLGDVTAEEVLVSFYLDGVMQGGQQLIPSIPSGEAADATMTWTGAIGDHVLMVKVDEQDAIKEANESNNLVVRSFTVYPAQIVRPNLYVDAQNISYSPNPPQSERVLKFNVTVWNLGNDSANDIDVQLLIDGEQLDGMLNIPYLAPGQSAVVTGMWMPSGGGHTFKVIVDPDNTIVEWDEEDNQAQVQVQLPADPVEIPWLPILAIISLGVLAYGIYAYMGKRKRGRSKQGGENKEP